MQSIDFDRTITLQQFQENRYRLTKSKQHTQLSSTILKCANLKYKWQAKIDSLEDS